jgi:hypothetical protein
MKIYRSERIVSVVYRENRIFFDYTKKLVLFQTRPGCFDKRVLR